MGEAFSLSRLQGCPYVPSLRIFEGSQVSCRSGLFVFVQEDYREPLGRGYFTLEPAILVSLPAAVEFAAL